MQHTQVVHGKDLLYYCKQCDISFNGMEQMRDHAKRFHTYYKKKREQQGQEQEQEIERRSKRKSKDKKKHHSTNLKNSEYPKGQHDCKP